MTLVSCDDVIEEELPNKKPENNDFLLLNFTDKVDNSKKYALYKFNDCENLTEDIKESVLGKKRNASSL